MLPRICSLVLVYVDVAVDVVNIDVADGGGKAGLGGGEGGP